MPDERRLALVTGASGFIGGHLVEALLHRGWRIRCLVRRASSVRWLPLDAVDLVHADMAPGEGGGTGGEGGKDARTGAAREALEGAVADTHAVFHLAALTSAARDEAYARVNVEGTRRIAAAVRAVAPDATLVLCSSLAAGGPARPGCPAREDDPPHPVSAYGRSKLAAERALAEAGVRHVIVRPPAVYGPRDVDILAGFRLANRGLAFRLAPPGQELSLIHARDLAEGLVLAAERSIGARDRSGVADARREAAQRARVAGEALYYMSDGVVHRWEELVSGIGAAVGRKPRVVPVPGAVVRLAAMADRLRGRIAGRKPLLTPDRARELRMEAWTCDDSKARAELGYTSRIELDEGLRETAAWYRREGWL